MMEKYNKKYLAFASTIATTMLLGIYTQSIEWVPQLRTLSHFFGAIAVPGYASLFTSSLIYSYENRKNKKINKENKLQNIKEEQKDMNYKMNPRIKSNLLKASMAIGSLGYIAFCGLWESFQFSQTNILQLSQYIADISGPLIGMATIGAIDARPLYDKIDKFTDKIIKKFNKTKENVYEKEHQLEENEKSKEPEKMPTWDLRNYGETKEGYQQKVSKIVEHRENKDTKEISKSDMVIE